MKKLLVLVACVAMGCSFMPPKGRFLDAPGYAQRAQADFKLTSYQCQRDWPAVQDPLGLTPILDYAHSKQNWRGYVMCMEAHGYEFREEAAK